MWILLLLILMKTPLLILCTPVTKQATTSVKIMLHNQYMYNNNHNNRINTFTVFMLSNIFYLFWWKISMEATNQICFDWIKISYWTVLKTHVLCGVNEKYIKDINILLSLKTKTPTALCLYHKISLIAGPIWFSEAYYRFKISFLSNFEGGGG